MLEQKLQTQLERDEGFRQFPYEDTVGKLTIGIGRNLDDKGISRSEALDLLHSDIAEVRAGLSQQLPWMEQLDDARKGVLLNMAFNMGVVGLLGFQRMLMAVQDQDWQTAAAEMESSRWWGQVGPRAERLQQQMLTGEWQ